jgi:putative transposase
LLRGQGKEPFRIITDKLKSYAAASRTILPGVIHDTQQYANNRAELSHQPTPMREQQMRRFKSPGKLSAFYRSTVSSGIYFALRDIC